MKISTTLSAYIGRQFVIWFAVVFAGIAFVVLLADAIELLRRAAGKDQATFAIVAEMALLKLPQMMLLLMPFAVLFGGMLAYWRLARTRELVVTRAAGVSVWQFLLPALFIALMIGATRVAVLGPFAAAMLSRYENLEALHLSSGTGSQLSVSDSGVWLRQLDPDGESLIHADHVEPTSRQLLDVVIFRFAGDGRFLGRIDADSADLEGGTWLIRGASLSDRRAEPKQVASVTLPTDLTWAQIESSLALPETMSVWELASFIPMMERTGFATARHRLHLQSQLASPLLLCAMVLIAASSTLRANPRGRAAHMIMIGVGIGFAFYIASDIVAVLGLSGRLPAELAAWAPASVCTMLGTAMLFHLEDG